jgi:TatD DNase family protein
MLTDSHCHLASGNFSSDLDEVIERAVTAKVSRMVTISTDLEDSSRCIEIAKNNDSVSAAVGIHPCSVTEITNDNWIQEIRKIAEKESVAAAPSGWTEQSYRDLQSEFFHSQLELAAELGLNVVIHHRDRGDECWKDINKIIDPFHGKLRAVFHCFSSSWESAKSLIEQDHLISFTGIVTFKNASEIQRCVKSCPVNSFMIETDSPYLAPVPFRGKRCEPSYAMTTAQFIADLRKISIESLSEKTSETADSFFRF